MTQTTEYRYDHAVKEGLGWFDVRTTVPVAEYDRVIAWRDRVWREVADANWGSTHGDPPEDVARTIGQWLSDVMDYCHTDPPKAWYSTITPSRDLVRLWTVQPDDGSGRWAIGPQGTRRYATGDIYYEFTG